MGFTPRTLHELLGGAEGVRALVDAFYDVMDRDPRAQEIRAMHPADLAESRDKLYEFLSGWTGGPALYHEKRGHPRLRFRHLPFPIGRDQAAQWLYCMQVAIRERRLAPDIEERLMQGLTMTAQHMINREE